MGNVQICIVPKISTVPNPQAKARAIRQWLIKREIIVEQLSACGSTADILAYASGPRGGVVDSTLSASGMEIVLERGIFTPLEGFTMEAGCPECRREIGEPLFESLDEWLPGHTENYICPLCEHEDDVNGFIYPQACAFSNLGFIFNNWSESFFKPGLLEEFAARLGYPVAMVVARS